MTGPRIPGYRYVEHLGSGGFADVFLFEQDWPRQRVAIKVVRPDIPLTDREKTLFTSEADAMASLADHPYIVTVMNAGTTDDGRPYLVMRYCPPPDLGVRVRANPMPVAEAISTGIKLASAIETAHRSGILHRDIKPSNVLVTTYSEPALTDFGIASHIHDVDADNDVRISYPWSPPEMLDGRSNGSVASDVYSLGATIWHLLVGRSPFSIPGGDNSTQALSARIMHATPPGTQRPDAPPALDRLLQQCLAKRPEHRPQSAMELARSLQRIEAAAGFPRTPIAVEADGVAPTGQRMVLGAPDPDETKLKPPTVVTGSTPRTVTTIATPEAADTARRTHRTAYLTAAGLAGAVLAGLATYWVVGSSGGGEPGPDRPTLSVTPTQSGLTGVPTEKPQLTGRRTGDKVLFTFAYPGGLEAGDSWNWRRTDTGAGGRGDRSRVSFTTADRVCLQVQLIRGQFESPWTDQCVD